METTIYTKILHVYTKILHVERGFVLHMAPAWEVNAVGSPENFHRGGQMGPVTILGWHTKSVLLMVTQIRLRPSGTQNAF